MGTCAEIPLTKLESSIIEAAPAFQPTHPGHSKIGKLIDLTSAATTSSQKGARAYSSGNLRLVMTRTLQMWYRHFCEQDYQGNAA
jgi:hypothetical protein